MRVKMSLPKEGTQLAALIIPDRGLRYGSDYFRIEVRRSALVHDVAGVGDRGLARPWHEWQAKL